MPASTQQRFLNKLFSNGYSEIGARRAIEHFRWPEDVVTVAKRVVALWFTKKAKRDVDVEWLFNYVAEAPVRAATKAAAARPQPKAAAPRTAAASVVATPAAKPQAPRGRPAKAPAQTPPATRKRTTVQMLNQMQQETRKDPDYVQTSPIFGGSSRSRVLRPAELEMLAVAVDISTIAKNTAEGLRALGESPESDARRTAHQALIWSADWLQFFRLHVLVYMQKEGMISEADLATAQASLAAESVKPLASSKAPVKAPVRPAKPVAAEEEEDFEAEESDEDEDEEGAAPSVEDEEEGDDAEPEAEDGDEEEDEDDEEGDNGAAAAALESEDDADEEPAAGTVGAPRPARPLV